MFVSRPTYRLFITDISIAPLKFSISLLISIYLGY